MTSECPLIGTVLATVCTGAAYLPAGFLPKTHRMHVVDVTLLYGHRGGGVKTYLLAKRRFLQRNDKLRHTIVVPSGAGSDEAVLGMPSVRLPFADGYRFPLGRLVPLLRELRPDVIEVGDASHLAWGALRAGQQLGVPVLAFYHSDLPEVAYRRFGSTAGALVKRYVANLYSRFDLVMAPSRSTAAGLTELGVERVVRQSLGVDTSIFTPTRRDGALRAELGLPAETRLLIYAGRFVVEKNLSLLVRTMALLGPPYHLLAVGGARIAGAPRNVTFVGFERGREKLARLLASSDALLHAGDQETFGLAVLEAMACAIPVVGVARGGVAELVDSATGAMAPTATARELGAAVIRLYASDLPQLGANARSKVERHYAWERIVPRIIRIYTHVSRSAANAATQPAGNSIA